ncbi:iron-containing redox enzyme family protein [Myxococcota bacterium]|nr:iron-containing redox enzyme family protein [Myxococcota bacterium]
MALSSLAFETKIRELLDELWPYALAFYHPLLDGRVQSREHLEQWCSRFYIKDVGVLLARTYAKCPHLEARKFIAENLWEEEGRGQPGRSHPELSARLPHHFGVEHSDLEERHQKRLANPQSRGRQEIVEKETWLEEFAGFGLGAEFYAPAFFELILERLREEFQLPEEVLEFFIVHLTEDEDHSRRTMEIVLRYADTDEEQARVLSAIRRHVMGEAGLTGRVREPTPLPDEVVEKLRSVDRSSAGSSP